MNRRITTTVSSALFATLLSATSASARILNVPENFQTIQTGIDSAWIGDTILVAPGVYDENVVFNVDGATLASLILTTGNPAYIDSTIIDAGGRDCGMSVEVESGVVRGFTVRNGSQGYGGGIDCRQNDRGPVILEDLIVTGCTAGAGGGGVYFSGSRNTIMRRARIFGNTAEYGGGFACRNSILHIDDCELTGNRADYKGGGVSDYDGSSIVYMNRVLIADNSAPNYAALSDISNSRWILNRTSVTSNHADSADSCGGINIDYSDLTNSIIYGNSGSNQITILGNGRLSVAYCDIEGGLEQIIHRGQRDSVNWGEGNIDADPRFVNAEEGDYHLAEGSPCIDAGDPADRDPDGTPPELGAYSILQRSAVIRGRVRDITNDSLIAGASVEVTRAGGVVFLDTTDANGVWGSWTPLWADPLEVTVRVTYEGYSPWRGVFNVHNGDTLFVESRMGVGRLAGPENPPQVSLREGDSVRVAVELRNGGNVPVNWSASWRALGQLAGSPGEITRSVNVGAMLDDDRIVGVAFDGEHYYLAGANGDDSSAIYVLDSDFQFIWSFPQPCHTRYGMRDLEWDGELLWGSGDSTIYGFTRDGELRVSFRGLFNPNTNIAYDPVRQTLWTSTTTTRLAEFDRRGNLLDTLSRKRLRIYGLGWDEFDPDGYKLQILTYDIREYPTSLYKMNVETGDTIKAFDLPDTVGVGVEGLFVIQSRTGQATALTIRNITAAQGGDRLDLIQLRGNREWISLAPENGTIGAGESGVLQVSLKTTGGGGWAFEAGNYQAEIIIRHDGPEGEIRIPIELTVTTLNAPESGGDGSLPQGFTLSSFPNPFNGSIIIRFSTGGINPRATTLRVYGVDGRLVEELWTGRDVYPPGEHSIVWNAEGLPGGMYLVRLESDSGVRTMKTIYLK